MQENSIHFVSIDFVIICSLLMQTNNLLSPLSSQVFKICVQNEKHYFVLLQQIISTDFVLRSILMITCCRLPTSASDTALMLPMAWPPRQWRPAGTSLDGTDWGQRRKDRICWSSSTVFLEDLLYFSGLDQHFVFLFMEFMIHPLKTNQKTTCTLEWPWLVWQLWQDHFPFTNRKNHQGSWTHLTYICLNMCLHCKMEWRKWSKLTN